MKPFATLFATLTACAAAVTVTAQDIDVYFIAGQSNAGNIGEQAGTGATDVGFTLTAGHLPDRPIGTGGGGFPGGTGPDDVLNAYSSNLLNTSKNLNQLAVGLYQGNDIAIFTFGRNGRSLTNPTSAETWYPGDGTTNNDDDLYGDFQVWSAARLAELATDNPGSTATVKGLFWFQGESDSGQTGYQTDYENLVDRFREDFNEDIAVVGTKLRELANATNNAGHQVISNALQSAADADPLIGVVETTVNADGTGGPLDDRFGNFNTDVHFSNAAQTIIVGRWAEESLRIQAGLVGNPLGDLNGDFQVDEADLAIILGRFGQAVSAGSLNDGDPTGDGLVNASDVDLILRNWTGSSPPPTIIPEPGSFALLGSAGLVLLRRRR